MKLITLLENIDFDFKGSIEVEINEINYDSRKINRGDVFVAISGLSVDGHSFIDIAIRKGAATIICEKEIEIEGVTVIKVKDSRKALAILSANYFSHPEKKMKIIGVTGTNGKTTSVFMMKKIFESKGFKVGLVGTIANYIGDRKIRTDRTTPESLELFKLFDDMVKEKVDYCLMEVSSHSLELFRVYGINFSEGIFTNLTQDHLDFHNTFENYFNAKAKLFKNCEKSIINIDDSYGIRLSEGIKDKITFSIEGKGDLNAKSLYLNTKGVEFDLYYINEKVKVKLNIAGVYNVQNALGCIGAAICEGFTLAEAVTGIEELLAVPGRCETVTHGSALNYDIILDYAHTPDGLLNILKTVREFTEKKLITVFGCGGDRDKNKRPLMGEIAERLSDFIIITSDNPRSEEPLEIINDIMVGIKKEDNIIIENRREAIKASMKMAKEGDVVVIAGKGHEDYQILKNGTIHFDEREIINEIIKELY